MADGNFLPEADQNFLAVKELEYRLLSQEIGPGEMRRGIEFVDFQLPPNLFTKGPDGTLVAGQKVSIMVLIPAGYDEAKLDSWYVDPPIFCANGQPARNAGGTETHFGRSWQFWSRHLGNGEWRPGIDGFETYLQYINAGLKAE